MPKNIFQRPQPVARTNNVPRHGAPLPVKKLEARKLQPKLEAAPLPSLDTLLAKAPRN